MGDGARETIIGYSGARTVPTGVSRHVLLSVLVDSVADEYVTGAARGMDALIGHFLTKLFPHARHTVIVPANRSQVDYWFTRIATVPTTTVVLMPEGTSYRQRNQAIIERATELHAFPAYPRDDPRSYRSGTWQTVRMAERAGMPVRQYVLEDLGKS